MNWPRKFFIRTFFLSCLLLCFPVLSLAIWQPVTFEGFDLTGDGLGDLVTYDPSTSIFKVRDSKTGESDFIKLGDIGDLPSIIFTEPNRLPSLATFNPSNGLWRILKRNNSVIETVMWTGKKGDVPVILVGSVGLVTYNMRTGIVASRSVDEKKGDFSIRKVGGPQCLLTMGMYPDGSFSCFRQYDRRWVMSGGKSIKFGRVGDIPVPGNYVGNEADEIAVYKPDVNVFEYATKVSNSKVVSSKYKQWGLLGDKPISVNVEGDSMVDFGVFRSTDGSFYLTTSTNYYFRVPFINSLVMPSLLSTWKWGENTLSNPIVVNRWMHNRNKVLGDYDRDGKSDFVTAIVNRSLGITTFTINNGYGTSNVVVNAPGDALVPADYNGDGITQPAVVTVDPSNALLKWTVKNPNGAPDTVLYWGENGDQPIVGDYDGDGKADYAVARTINGYVYWYFYFATGETKFKFLHGIKGDKLFAADVDGDRTDELIAVRKIKGGWTWFYRGLDEKKVKSSQWGLVKTDLPVRPNDLTGDGASNFIVLRNNGAGRSILYKSSDPRFRNASWPKFPWKEIKHGLKDDITVFGNFSGDNKTGYAIFRRSGAGMGAPGFIYSLLSKMDVIVRTGRKNSVVISPDSSVYQVGEGIPGSGSTPTPPPENPNPPSPTVGCKPTPGTPGDFHDGARRGALWKPVSEGVGNRASVMLLPMRYCGANVVALGSKGQVVSGIQRRKCGGNGNRAHFWFSKRASQMKPYAPLTIKIQKNGITECRVVPNPQKRYD